MPKEEKNKEANEREEIREKEENEIRTENHYAG
jgi:hypothetical protein